MMHDPKNDEELGITNDNELIAIINQMYNNCPGGKNRNPILRLKIKLKKTNYYTKKIKKFLPL